MRKSLVGLCASLVACVSITMPAAAPPALAAGGGAPPNTVVIFGPAPDGLTSGAYVMPKDEFAPQGRAAYAIQAMIQRNVEALGLDRVSQPASTERVALAFPLRSSHSLSDPGLHSLFYHVDHNPARPNQLSDFACGARTYDTASYDHTGSDFATWPLPFLKMDNNEVEVVAAAQGVIVAKEDGNPDRSCALNGNSWNAVYVRHADNTTAWYGHLKRGSLTGKPIGAAVAVGEYLGVVGSSGSSTGPHLHFELRDSANNVLDPFFDGSAGHNCNPSATASWWTAQPPPVDPAINKVTTGGADPNFPACPAPEVPSINDNFTLGAGGSRVYLTAYYRDLQAGQLTTYTIFSPDGAPYAQWQHTNIQTNSASYHTYNMLFPATVAAGTWRAAFTFQGVTTDAFFNLGAPITIQVTRPAAGETWPRGIAREVNWTDNLGGRVRIEIWRGGGYFDTVAKSAPSNGVAGYTMPLGACPGTYSLRVIDEANPAIFGQAVFTVPGNCIFVPLTLR